MKIILAINILLVIRLNTMCQESESIEQFHKTFSVNEKGIHGDGWDLLLEQAEQASVVFIGEDHGLAETPLFTRNLFSHLFQYGFNSYLGEIGTVSSEVLLEKMRKTTHREWIKEFPISIPFVNWVEEIELLEYLDKKGVDIYGIDQEFLLSPIIHLTNLEKLIINNEVIRDMVTKERKAIDRFLSEGNYLDLFMVSALEQDFDDLDKMFEQEKAKVIVNQLRSSFRIYRTMMNGRGKQSNELRSQLMSDNYEKIKSANKEGKMILKLGALHCYRENAPTGVEEIGMHVAAKDSSFHILVLGQEGKFNNYTAQSGFNKLQKEAPYNIRKRFPVDLSAFLAFTKKNEWSYFDLKSIRNNDGQFPSEVEKLAMAFDALVIIPEVKASLNLE